MPVSARTSDVQELLSQLRIRLVVPAPEGRPSRGLGLANATHLGAQMSRFEVDGYAVGLQDAREGLGDLAAESLLKGKPPSEEPYQPGELRDADDVFVGDVAQVGVAEEGEGVVFAERVKGDRTFDHLAELTVRPAGALRRKCGHQLGVALIALGRIEHRPQAAQGRLLGTRGVEMQAHRGEDLPHVTLEAEPVGLADAPRTDALQIATFDVIVAQTANARS